MSDLMKHLYHFALEYRMDCYLIHDEEHRQSCRCAEKRERLLRAALTPEQAGWLDDLLDEQSIACSAELEAAFQSGFAMAMELNRFSR